MSVTVVNRGVWERDASGNKDTKVGKQTHGDSGTVRVIVENIEYVFAPGQSKSFSDNGLGIAIAAADARLAMADTREGFETKTTRT